MVVLNTIDTGGNRGQNALFFDMRGFAEDIYRLSLAQSGGQMGSQNKDYVNLCEGVFVAAGLKKCRPVQYSHKKNTSQPAAMSATDDRNKKNKINDPDVTNAPPRDSIGCGTSPHMQRTNTDRIELRREVSGALHSLVKSINLGKVEISRAITNRRHIEPQSINALLALAVADLDEPEAWPEAGNAPDGRDRDVQRWARSIVAFRLRELLGHMEREDELRRIAAETPIIGPCKVGDRGRRGKRHGKIVETMPKRRVLHLAVAK